jgi:hypothetical protein
MILVATARSPPARLVDVDDVDLHRHAAAIAHSMPTCYR